MRSRHPGIDLFMSASIRSSEDSDLLLPLEYGFRGFVVSLFGCVGTERSQLKGTWCSLQGRRRIWGLGELMVTRQPLLSAINSEKLFTKSLLPKFCHEHLITINRKYTCAVIIVTGYQRTFLLKVYMWKVVVCVCVSWEAGMGNNDPWNKLGWLRWRKLRKGLFS